ncbi:alcohol dehydrogenase catalytic domain-containing protein [Mesorhizobium kowhaii]|uniref:alcohol dehydrogenase n=1 Tax=Mesorhizobium kowhaii TaxID=1300272 RepID=A0A2W7BWG1_9HYPH|nr:alcohol dehydrogenase catalytic domain-containing protein [Mesorhizobium kowhaii]PZV34917.1 zinc-binding alcohol dehydrogenase [Mesorhizobium kowhaii]
MNPSMMSAAVLVAHRKALQLACLPVPKPGPREILVRLEACGVCHTDVHIWQGDVRPTDEPRPFVLGHEGVGRVVELGGDVDNWKIGESIGVPWLHDTCQTCDECIAGAEPFCQAQRAHGLNVPGAFAEYVVVDSRFAVRLPEGVDPLQTAPVMCAGVTAFGAVRRANVRIGETVAVFGCGGLGLYAVQIAARAGARVIGIDRDPEKLRRARELGAVATFLADEMLEAAFDAEHRAHACINFAPTAVTWKAMVSAVRPRGRIVAAAMVSQAVPLNQEWLTATGVTITGTSVGTRTEMQETVAIHAVRPLRNEIVPITLKEASTALEALANGRAAGRFVIDFR